MVEYSDIAYFLSKDLISKNSRDEIYEKIIITTATFIKSDLIAIFMLNDDTEKINCVKYYENGNFIKKDFEIILGQGLIGSVIENGESLVSSNLESDLSDIYYALEKQFTGMSSMLSMPIYAGPLVIGSLNIYQKNSYQFSEDEIQAAKFIAMMGGVFVYSLTLYENENLLYLKQKEESQKLTNLFEISKLVSSSLDLSSIIDYSVKKLMSFTRTNKSFVYLKNKDRDENKFCYEFFGCNITGCSIFGGSINCYNMKEFECQFKKCSAGQDILNKCHECDFFKGTALTLFKSYNADDSFDPPESIKLEDCICLKTFGSGLPTINYFDENQKKNDYNICGYFFEGFEKRTFIGIPIKTDGDFLGLIFLFDKKKMDYSAETIDFIANTSAIISVAVYNAQTLNHIEEEHFETINSISEAIEARDTYTRTHGDRIVHYGVLVGRELGLSESQIKNIRYAAALHDVGKIGIRDSILLKQGKLTEEEYIEIKKHPEIGYNMLKKIKFLKHISNDVLHHQERYDGKGYPLGLSGEDIPIVSRIIAVIDAFDAMTTDRPYRKALPIESALEEIINNSGSQFDPNVVKAFLKVVNSEPDTVNP